LDQCLSTFLLQRNPKEVSKSPTEPLAMIRESSGISELSGSFGVSRDRCFQWSQRGRKPVHLWAKPLKADDKTAGKVIVKFDRNR